MKSPHTLCLCLALILPACSGSSSGDAGPGSQNTETGYLVVDTAGGEDGQLSGRLTAVALEDESGGMTANLIGDQNPEVLLNDPAGTAFGLGLQAFGPGRFVAVHFGILPGSLQWREGIGPGRAVALVGGSVRAPLQRVLEVGARATQRIELRHHQPIELVTGPSGDLSWEPEMIAAPSDLILLEDATIQILSVDLAKASAVGSIESLSGLRTEVRFLPRAALVVDDAEVTVAGFLGSLLATDTIRVFGVLDGGSVTHVAFAERIDALDPTPGQGRKNKVRGTVTAVDPISFHLEVRLSEIRIGGRDIPKNQPVTLGVDSTEAKIKYLPRYGQHPGHLPPSSLKEGMFVEVEWHGGAPNLEIVAHKINIRSNGRFGFHQRISGVVGAVDPIAGTILLRPDEGGVFRFGAETFAELIISADAGTMIVAGANGIATALDLASLRPGEALRILGRKTAGASFAATLVVADRSR